VCWWVPHIVAALLGLLPSNCSQQPWARQDADQDCHRLLRDLLFECAADTMPFLPPVMHPQSPRCPASPPALAPAQQTLTAAGEGGGLPGMQTHVPSRVCVFARRGWAAEATKKLGPRALGLFPHSLLRVRHVLKALCSPAVTHAWSRSDAGSRPCPPTPPAQLGDGRFLRVGRLQGQARRELQQRKVLWHMPA
jgi:hypothetical protein